MWDDCNENSRGSNWNKLTLSKELLNIRSEAYQNNNPENYFFIGPLLYYNMSYFGSSLESLCLIIVLQQKFMDFTIL